jgi:HEAT repeat protein
MSVIELLRRFDGRHVSALEALSVALPRCDSTVDQLLSAAGFSDTTVQVGATWVLKRWLEEGVPQVEESAAVLVELLKIACHWEVRLHLLQILSQIRIPTRSREALRVLLLRLTADQNKLVRAWALSVYAELADQSEVLRHEVLSALQGAETDCAASVRARVRQIRKLYSWTSLTGRPQA